MSYLQACDFCHRPRFLLAPLAGGMACARCWRRAGEPFPAPAPPKHEDEESIRRQMLKRGGDERYQVTSGRT